MRRGLRERPGRERCAPPNDMVEDPLGRAEVAELADASVSKTDVRKDVRVRLPVSAPCRSNGGGPVAGYGEPIPAFAGECGFPLRFIPACAGACGESRAAPWRVTVRGRSPGSRRPRSWPGFPWRS